MGRNGARGGAGPSFRRSRCGFARIQLRFDAPAVVSREFRCVSTLPLWFRANSVAFRCSGCGFARSGVLWPLLGEPLRLRAATAHAVGRPGPSFRRSRYSFARIPLRFDAPAVVSREFQPLLACSGLFWGSRLSCGPQRRTRWGGAFVSTLPLWFRANSVAFRRSRCDFARIPLRFDAPAVVSREFRPLLACSGLFWGGHLGSHELLYFWSSGVSVIFRGLPWPLLALLTVWGLRRHNIFKCLVRDPFKGTLEDRDIL